MVPCSFLPHPAQLELSPVELDLITLMSPAVASGHDLATHLALDPLASELTGLRVLKHPHSEQNPEQHLLG